jgi:hypothetical protein
VLALLFHNTIISLLNILVNRCKHCCLRTVLHNYYPRFVSFWFCLILLYHILFFLFKPNFGTQFLFELVLYRCFITFIKMYAFACIIKVQQAATYLHTSFVNNENLLLCDLVNLLMAFLEHCCSAADNSRVQFKGYLRACIRPNCACILA